MPVRLSLALLLWSTHTIAQVLLAPLHVPDRAAWDTVALTEIGAFGMWRNARPGVPPHFHTGIDLVAAADRTVFPSAPGRVISVRDDGPFAQIIIAHHIRSCDFWTIYEHISGITVHSGQMVLPDTPIGRLMNANELKRWGRQFNHLHFEVMMRPPTPLKATAGLPERHYGTWALNCYTKEQLNSRYINPLKSKSELPCIK